MYAGSVWVFGTQDYHPQKIAFYSDTSNCLTSSNGVTSAPNTNNVYDACYCDDVLHKFSFAITIIYYFHILMVAILSVVYYRKED